MGLFNAEDYRIVISSKFARQQFLCSEEYCAGVCHGACCRGPSVVLLTDKEARDLQISFPSLPVSGNVLFIRGKMCPLAFPNGLCRIYNTKLKPFVCNVMPFRLNNSGKLIIDNGYMRRSCRVRKGSEGGLPAYKAFKMALVQLFGEDNTDFIVKHFDSGGGDITVPVSRDVMEKLQWHLKVINDIKKFGYTPTIEKLSRGI